MTAERDAAGHYSDCATYNEPALPAGPCDCGAPVTLSAVVLRSFLRPDGGYAASVETENQRTLYVLTETKLEPGSPVKVKPAACGWEIA